MADGGNWVAAFVLTALAVAGGVIVAGYIGGAIAKSQGQTSTG